MLCSSASFVKTTPRNLFNSVPQTPTPFKIFDTPQSGSEVLNIAAVIILKFIFWNSRYYVAYIAYEDIMSYIMIECVNVALCAVNINQAEAVWHLVSMEFNPEIKCCC